MLTPEQKQEIIEIIDDQAGGGTVIASTNLSDDLGIDSLDAIELIMVFESKFDIVIPDDHMENIVTVQDIFDYLDKAI